MSENFTNTSAAKTNSFNKGMVKDYTDIYMSEGLWLNAINAINNAHYGETGSIGNEPSNKFCITAPFTIIGFANITRTRWVLFSTNDIESEIGIFEETDCSYVAKANSTCLGFKRTNLISAEVKKNYDCTYSVYFADNLNPDRVLNLDRVPYKVIGDANADPYCYEPQYSNELDCDALRLHPLVTQPCVTVKKAQGAGQLNNGSYMACVAYSENGIRLTDYSIPSAPQGLWDHTGMGGGLEITIDNLDQNFEEYELVVIAVVNQQSIAKKIGNYSIRQKNVTLDLFQQSLPTVDIAQIPLKSIIYEKSEKLFNINNYLIRTGVTTQPYINYQQQANRIKTEWVAVEYPAEYYWGGGNNTSYMRDEVYSFFIRWVYKTGARTASFHIPGRPATQTDLQSVETNDVVYSNETKTWQVYDTSTKYNSSGTTTDGGAIIARGKMGYWESTERYPDDKAEIWGSLCGRQIRHHKMPSNETTHIHNQGGDKIVLLGVEFNNIQHPVDENGYPIADIVGYEILRGSREGNRSIIAKGMFNNMQEYNIQGSSRKGLFQNYPYNDLRPDGFLTDDYSVLDEGSGNPGTIESANKLDKYKRDIFSFHSVETNFIKPYIGDGAHVKIYTEERGTVRGRFEFPYKHPKHIILTNTSFTIAATAGLGIAIVASVGKTTTTGGQFPLVAASGSPFGYATRESGIGSIATDILTANTLQASSGIASGSLLGSAAGFASLALSAAYYWGQGINQVLEVIRNFSKTKQYMIQYNSHGFYNRYTNVSNNTVPSGLSQSFRRPIANSGARYIGSGLHDLDATHRINNLYRNKYVAVKLDGLLPDPSSTSDNTKHRVRDGGVSYADPNKDEVITESVSYYGAMKVDFQNQYGQLGTIVQLPTSSCVYTTTADATIFHRTDVIFGGDVYINRYTEKNPYFFFNSWMYDMPDKTDYDYRNYVNGPAPRYWVNLEDFDGEDFNIDTSLNFTVPSSYHRLDRRSFASGTLVVKNAYAYLFYNGVRDFFVESELNMAFRDYGENDYDKFYDVYGNSFNDLSTMFRSDMINKPIYYKYDLSLSASKLFNNFASWGSILPRDYDPRVYSTCFEYYPNRAVYSLQQQDGLRRDNWKNFLPLNYKDFGGRINTIKSLNATGAMILFENKEPLMFVGVDQLQTTAGVKVSVGDGGLFQGNMQAIVNADDALGYASSISSRAAINTPHGLFFVSQQTGKVLHYQGGIQEISANGMKHWFNQNLPSKMLQTYPNFPLYDNPVVGVGVQMMYDGTNELLYITKRDYRPLRDDMLVDEGGFYYISGYTSIDIPGSTTYTCPPGFTLVGDTCTKIETAEATETGNTIELARTPLEVYGNYGTRLYNTADVNSNYTILNTSNSFWIRSQNPGNWNTLTPAQKQAFDLTNGPVNRLAVWGKVIVNGEILNNYNLGSNDLTPENEWIGFDVCVNITETKTYYVCLAADNQFRFSLDGTIVLSKEIAATETFNYLHIFPLTINSGTHIVRVEGLNTGQNAGFGCEIFDLTDIPEGTTVLQYLEAQTDYTNLESKVIFTTRTATTFTSNLYSCPPGFGITQPSCNQPECQKITNLEPEVIVTPPRTALVPNKIYMSLDDPYNFENASWTVSYDPKTKMWISFHDWKPTLMMPSYKHFFSINGNSIWRHNERWDNYCNYYGVDYPWEIEYPVVTPNNITTLRSIEYTLDVYKFYNDGKDFHHVLDANFDRAILYNSEQISGLLKLTVKGKNSPLDMVNYPVISANNIEILFSKEENKYRFNQFWDVTKDRGEFSGAQEPMWNTQLAGYQKTINPNYINYFKSPLEHKKFRHYNNTIILRKNKSEDKKMILKLTNSKHLNSSR